MKKEDKAGTRAIPWTLNTPSGGSEFQAFRDEKLDPPALVIIVGKRNCATSCDALKICTQC